MFFPHVSHRPEDPILFCIDELLNMYDGDDPELTFAGTEDEVAAASKIQAMNRGKLARKELQEQSDAATKMQAVQRGKAARKSIGGGWRRASLPRQMHDPRRKPHQVTMQTSIT